MSNPTRTRSPRGHGDRLAHELVDAAERLLLATGSATAVSLRGIAREAGVSAPSVYLHFPDKDAVVQAAVDRRFRELAARITAASADHHDPVASLHAGCLAYCRFAVEEPGGYRMLFEAEVGDPRDTTAGLEAFTTLVEGVAGAVEAGRCPPQDPFATATLVWSGLHGLVSLRTARPAFPWPALEELVEELLVRLVGLDAASPGDGGPAPADARSP